MFDLQHENRFGKREESVQELISVLNGITNKLIPSMDTIYEWARLRDIYMNEKYGTDIDDRTKVAPIRKQIARDEAELLWYDPRFESDLSLSIEEIKEAKARRKLLVAKSNEVAVMIMQFDNVVEQIASRTYDECFNDNAADTFYKEGLIRMKIDSNIVNNMVLQMRGLRNMFCHTYAFHKVFLEMSIGKVIYSRLTVILMNKMGLQLGRMYACSVELNKPGLGIWSPHNPSVEMLQKTKWVSLPRESIRKEFFKHEE